MASVKPKKHLGQHFLKDENIARKIVQALIGTEGRVIEIGPGTGVLTKYLIEKELDFLALDVDSESVRFLRSKYPDESHRFQEEDFLRFDLQENSYSIIGNFPYNISSQLFFKIWDERTSVKEVVCMVQKEVADRICSKEGSKVYGILSVLLQAFYDVEYLFTVPPSVFQPPPRVQSAVIRLVRNNVETLTCDENHLKRVVKAGFGKRRKTLRNALKDINLPVEIAGMKVLDLRAEQLSVADFISLTTQITSAWKR